jgi:uncharacterized protein YnzC (UPF0291/DUF896 family)
LICFFKIRSTIKSFELSSKGFMRREYIGLNLEKKQFVKIHIIDDHGSHKTPNFLKVMVIEG